LNKHKIIFSILLIIAVFTCLTSVYSSTQENQDHIISVDNIQFYAPADSNIVQFQLVNDTDFDDGTYFKKYEDQNHSRYTVSIYNLSGADDWDDFKDHVKEHYENASYERVNGVIVYNMTAGGGIREGEPIFQSYVINEDLQTIVEFGTPTLNETVKIGSTLKFR